MPRRTHPTKAKDAQSPLGTLFDSIFSEAILFVISHPFDPFSQELPRDPVFLRHLQKKIPAKPKYLHFSHFKYRWIPLLKSNILA